MAAKVDTMPAFIDVGLSHNSGEQDDEQSDDLDIEMVRFSSGHIDLYFDSRCR